MARAMPTMEMFMVGAYLQLVEGCDSVAYNSELPNPKQYWIEVVGRSEAGQSVFYVDIPEKFDWFPPEMRPDTMVRRLVQRYDEIAREGRALDYEPERIHCQVWMPRLPAPRVAEALPKAAQRLKEQRGISLELIEPAEVARRARTVAERALKSNFDYDNLFLRALLIAQGRLDYQAGAPMAQEQIEALYRFPLALRSAADIPSFVYGFLTSDEIVTWLGFYSPTFDDLRNWLGDMPHSDELADLKRALDRSGEPEEEPDGGYLDEDRADEDLDEDEDEDAESSGSWVPRRYTARELADLTRLFLAHIEAMRAEAASQRWYGPLQIEVDFMLPFLSRAQERIDPSQIEREILRYGGDRDQMLAHFASQYPEKRPYRAILRIEFYEPGGKRAPAYPSGKAMTVPIVDPRVSEGMEVGVTINYVDDFAGYFVLMMRRIAEGLSS